MKLMCIAPITATERIGRYKRGERKEIKIEEGFELDFGGIQKGWISKLDFDQVYMPIEKILFGQVLSMLKIGKKMRRKEWKEGFFILLDKGYLAMPSAENAKLLRGYKDKSKLTEWEINLNDILADNWEEFIE